MLEQNLFSGFGGQGVLLIGQLLAQAAMVEGKEVSWLPSYGPEMRGGTANCTVTISDSPIGSPMAATATAVIAMNQPSLEKFEEMLVPGGMLFINSSMVNIKHTRTDIQAFYIPCNDLAKEMGNEKVANMIMLGAFLSRTHSADIENVLAAISAKLGAAKAHLVPLNRAALEKGAEAAQ